MDQNTFGKDLTGRQLPRPEIDHHLALAEQFDRFTDGKSAAAALTDARAFIAQLHEQSQDSYENILALARYGRFLHNDGIFLAGLELLDGGEVMQNLYDRLAQSAGEASRDQVFDGIQLPTWGTPNVERTRRMAVIIERMEHLLDEGLVKQLLSACLRDLPEEGFIAERTKYAEAGDFDTYLEQKRQQFIAQLEQIRAQDGLYFNQKITQEVIDFVRENPEVAQGVRDGSLLYVTKIPFLAHEYLTASDPVEKRYYACHCPWAREPLKEGKSLVSPTFCLCSAGFVKKQWEVLFDQILEVDVLESALQGDLRCRFAIHLPAQALEKVLSEE
jgi:hypothetical protein